MPLDISRQILGPFGRLVQPEHRLDDALSPWIGNHDDRQDAAAEVVRTITTYYPSAIINGSCFVMVPVRNADLLPKDAA